jgi:hypothetical protein
MSRRNRGPKGGSGNPQGQKPAEANPRPAPDSSSTSAQGKGATDAANPALPQGSEAAESQARAGLPSPAGPSGQINGPMETRRLDIEMRLAAARAGQKRSRFAFLISTVVSLAVLISAWNAYFSWYRTFALMPAWAANQVTSELQKNLLAEWVKSRVIDISLLGIHVGPSDVPLLGSIGLCIISIWLFFSVRRENHIVGLLLRDTRLEQANVKRMIYNDIVAYLVFLHMTPIDMPIRSLTPDMKDPDPFTKVTQNATHLVAQAIAGILLFFPPIAILSSVAVDFLSVALESPFRYPHETSLMNILNPMEWGALIGQNAVAILLGIITALLSRATVVFEGATKNVLLEYEAGIPKD